MTADDERYAVLPRPPSLPLPPALLTPPLLPERYVPWPDARRALLGRGGASEVWRVQDRVLGILVALKVLRSEGARLAGKLEREALLSASVVHPNVIALHDMGRTPDGSPYLAFALASDGSLLDHAARLPVWSELKDQTIGILDALGALHAHGLLHLDVKLSNLLLHRMSPRRRVIWLADLGVARARWAEDEDEGMVLGTVGYMAPERLTGRRQHWGPPTDLFSVGAVLYRQLTGELPYTAKDPAQALAARQKPPGQVPVRDGIDVPAGLEDIVLALLQPDRRSRYDLACDVARALAALPDLPTKPATTSVSSDAPPRLALLAQVGEDSLLGWPPPDITAEGPTSRRLSIGRLGVVWHKPDPLRPPRRRPPPYIPRRVPQDPRLVAHREIPVVGRDAELDQLWAAARAVLRHRQPVLVSLSGDNGMGATRLVDELTRTLERVGIAQGLRLDYAGRASSDHGVDGALRRILPPLTDKRAYRYDIARSLSRIRGQSPTACRHDAAVLADLLGSGPVDASPDRTAGRTYVIEWLAAHAWRGLTWLWLDDVHLAGDGDDGWALVETIFATGTPTLVLASAIDTPAHRPALRPLRRLQARHGKRSWHINLDALSHAAARNLARAHLPMADDLATQLATTTGGDPRFMHELIVHLVREGALKPGDKDVNGIPQWTLVSDWGPLPTGREDFARRRLLRLTKDRPDLQHALLAARLAGSGTPERVVARVAGSALDELVTLGLLQVQGDRLTISSPELKDAIGDLPRDEDQDQLIHQNLAAAWLEEEEDAQSQARAGLHLAIAGDSEQALTLLHGALSRSVDQLRPRALARLALRTMDLAQQVKPPPDSPLASAWPQAALIRSDALWQLGKTNLALALDRQLHDQPRSATIAVQAACQHAQHLASLATDDASLERLAQVEDQLAHVSPQLRAAFYTARARLEAERGEVATALADVAEALNLQADPAVHARALLLRARLTQSTDPRGAYDTARMTQKLAHSHGLIQAELDAWDILGSLALRLGCAADTVAELEASIVRMTRVGQRTESARLLVTLGSLQRDRGDLDQVRVAYAEALRRATTGREPWTHTAQVGLALLAAIQGDGARLRRVVNSTGRSSTPADARLWTLLTYLADQLQNTHGAVVHDLPHADLLDQAALSGRDGLLVAELVVMALQARRHPDALSLQQRLRSLAQGQGIDRQTIDPLLARASMALATSLP